MATATINILGEVDRPHQANLQDGWRIRQAIRSFRNSRPTLKARSPMERRARPGFPITGCVFSKSCSRGRRR